jgi:hypothetical protein
VLNSKLKLKGLSLDEIIHEGVHGNIPEVTINDWKFIQSLAVGYLTPEEVESIITEQLDDTADCNYQQGLRDGGSDEREIERLQKLLKENNIEY